MHGRPTINPAVETTPRLLLTVEDAARRLGIGRTTAYELIASGRLESVTIGRLRRIPTDALSRFVESLAAG